MLVYQTNGWIGCRYTEAYEREWRQKEKAARERVAATNRDLAQARAAQQAARVAAQADMARLEAQEFHRIVEENRHSEQQQLEKVCTCAPDCIIYTLCIYVHSIRSIHSISTLYIHVLMYLVSHTHTLVYTVSLLKCMLGIRVSYMSLVGDATCGDLSHAGSAC